VPDSRRGIQKHKDKWLLTELQDVLFEVESDLRYRPPRTNRALTEGKEELRTEVTSDFVDEMQK
jgi:hypothetical protein